MVTKDGARSERRWAPTRVALVEKAEELFAENGIEAVSLRQIGAAIGSSNANVVGYHFGNKNALVAAVFEHRIPALDERRSELLRESDTAGQGQNLPILLQVLWLPLFEQTNDAGLHSYARFLGELIRSGRGEIRRTLGGGFPATDELMERIRRFIPTGCKGIGEGRWRLSVLLLTEALRMIDDSAEMNVKPNRKVFDDTLRMIAAALTAPTDDPEVEDRR